MTPIPVLHRCAHPECGALTFTRRCPTHNTVADAELLEALDEAAVDVILAAERLDEARQLLARLEARAGIRRT